MTKPLSIDRDVALRARPMQMVISRKDRPDGGAAVTVPWNPTRFQRWMLRVPENATRTFELDAMGVTVLDLCDGERRVTQIVQAFAKRFKLDPHEAHVAAIGFLRTLIQRGVIAMVVDAKAIEDVPEPDRKQ